MSAQIHDKERSLVEQRKKKALPCQCCNLPFAQIENGRLVINSRHRDSLHQNVLLPDDLRKLADEMERGS